MEFLTFRDNLENTFNGRKVYSEYVDDFLKNINIFNDIDNNFLDTWNDKRLYGRVNSWNKPVFPKKNKIISKEEKGITYSGLDFVIDMFFEFKKYYEETARKHKWDFRFQTTSMETYVHPVDLYSNYLNSIFRIYNDILSAQILDPYHVTFKTYLIELCAVLEKQRQKRILFSSYILSSDYDLASSGLFVDLTSADYFDDAGKVSRFFEKNHYKFLVESARRFGFLVDKNVPWRIVVDLNSFATSYFLKRRAGLAVMIDGGVEQHELEAFLEAFSTENDQYMFKNGKEMLVDIFYRYFSVAYWEGSGEINLFVDAAKRSFVEFKNNKNIGCINVYDQEYLMRFFHRQFSKEIGLFNIFVAK